MPEYLIFFNDEWVTETDDAGWQQRSRDVRAVVDETPERPAGEQLHGFGFTHARWAGPGRTTGRI